MTKSRISKEPEDKCREKYSISKGLLGLWEQTMYVCISRKPYNLKHSIEEV